MFNPNQTFARALLQWTRAANQGTLLLLNENADSSPLLVNPRTYLGSYY